MTIADLVAGFRRKQQAQQMIAPEILPNPELEQAVAPSGPALHPLIAALQKKSGLMNLVRNKRNTKQLYAQDLEGL